jgi:hypothetical protein
VFDFCPFEAERAAGLIILLAHLDERLADSLEQDRRPSGRAAIVDLRACGAGRP